MATRAAQRVAREIADHIEGPGHYRVPTLETLQGWILALAPPQTRRAPTASQAARKEHRASVAQLDALFREVIRRRDGYRCRRCARETQLQVAHIFSRRFLKLRWTPTNALLLCAGCHLWGHHNPVEAGRFFEEKVGTREYIRLAALKSGYGKAPDHRLVKIHLETELAALGG